MGVRSPRSGAQILPQSNKIRTQPNQITSLKIYNPEVPKKGILFSFGCNLYARTYAKRARAHAYIAKIIRLI